MRTLMWLAPAAGAAALLFALTLAMSVRRQAVGNDRMKEISGAIKEGRRRFCGRSTAFWYFLCSFCSC